MHHILVEGTNEYKILFEAAMRGNRCPVFNGIVRAEKGFCLDPDDNTSAAAIVALACLQKSEQGKEFFLAIQIEEEYGMLVKTAIQEVTQGGFRAAFHYSKDGTPRLILRPTISVDPKVFTAWGPAWSQWRQKGLPESIIEAEELLTLTAAYKKSFVWKLNKVATILWFLPYVLFGLK
jgi:hypothetical protein